MYEIGLTIEISKINHTNVPESEFKDLNPRLKFKTRLKYGWFHVKLYLMFDDLSRCLI